MGTAVDMNLQAAKTWLSTLESLNGQLDTQLKQTDVVVMDIAASGQGGLLDKLVTSYERICESSSKLVDSFGRFAESLGNMFGKAEGLAHEISEIMSQVGKFAL